MKVYCFKGIADTGKSMIIKRILIEVYNIMIDPEIEDLKLKEDFCLHFVHNNQKIGICSYGDAIEYVDKRLLALKKEKCDLIICASRTQRSVPEFIKKEFEGKIKFVECKWKQEDSDTMKDTINNERLSDFKTWLKDNNFSV